MYGPDEYSSEDDYFADDPDYEVYKEKAKQIRLDTYPKTDGVKVDPLDQIFQNICLGKTNEAMRLLLEGNVINEVLKDGWTPLSLACSMGNKELVTELIDKGADINVERDSLTPLMLACDCPKDTSRFENLLEIIKCLVDKGADVNAVDRRRKTALMFAAYGGNLEAVKFLLPLSNRNAEDNQRWTALFWAVYGNHPDVVQYFLDEGFSVERQDVREYTPFEMAKEFGLDDVMKLFPENLSRETINDLDKFKYDFAHTFSELKPGAVPQFFTDVCSILYGTRNQNLIPFFIDKNIGLKTLITFSDSELLDQGILLPYQRNRILTGLFQFHLQNYLPKSVPCVQKDEIYSNIDVCYALVSAVKQIIVMEAALEFIMKNCDNVIIKQEEMNTILQALKHLKKKVKSLKSIATKLAKNAETWDKQIMPADLILPISKKRRVPWRKIIFSLGLTSLILMKFSLRRIL